MSCIKSVTIIGSGPAGYVSALRCAQLGAEVTIIENSELGGTCLNKGCIPTKTLLQSSNIYELIKKSSKFGIKANNLSMDFTEAMKRKNMVVQKLVDGITYLLGSNNVKIIKGKAKFNTANQLQITTLNNESYSLDVENVIIATGSIATMLPIEGINISEIITSDQALEITDIPKSMIIIGGGVIGVEFATIFNSVGINVTIVEMMDQLLPNADSEIAETLKSSLEDKGIKIYLNSKIGSISNLDDNKNVVFTNEEGNSVSLISEKVLMCVGRSPNIKELELENAGVIVKEKGILVDKHMRTNISNIYAIGDVTGELLLAHVASKEGIIAAESLFGNEVKMDYNAVPSCIFTNPEIASVGLTEKSAIDKGYDIKIGRFYFKNNGKAMTMDENVGYVKIIVDVEYGEILGVHIVGPNASDLINECTLAINLGCTINELIDTIHVHPTLGESISEAALDVAERALHIPKINIIGY